MSDLNLVQVKTNYNTVWILAKRQLLNFWRSKSRVVSAIVQAILFLFVFGIGLSTTEIVIGGTAVESKAFTASGIGAVVILFAGIYGGMSVFQDKMFGFIKELMVAPVSRRTIMLGRMVGISLQTMIFVLINIGIGIAIGFFGYDLNLIWRVILLIPISFIASLGIVGIGLAISTKLSDMQAFGLVETFIVLPMMWLSGAIINLPWQILAFNPFSYSVDIFHFVLLGASHFPWWLDLAVLSLFGAVLLLIGEREFNKMEIS